MKSFVLIALLLAALVACFAPGSLAKEYSVKPSDGSVAINRIIASLKAGDILSLLPGNYVNIALQVNVKGRADAWITIRGVACGSVKPVLTINTDVIRKPNIDIGTGAKYINIAGLEVRQTGSRIYAGIKFHTGNTNIIIQNCNIINITGNGIDLLNLNTLSNILIRFNTIANVGLKITSSLQVGAGVVVGGLTRLVTGVTNIQIVNNVIHDIYGYEGAAIKALLGCVSLRVVDNVIWKAPLGLATGFKSSIYVATGITNLALIDLSLVARNLVLDSGLGVHVGTNIGIYVGAGTQCVNNIVLDAEIALQVGLGLNLNLNSGLDLALLGVLNNKLVNTNVVHNTVVRVSKAALRIVDAVGSDTLRVLNNVFAIADGVNGVVGKVFDLVEDLLQCVLGAVGKGLFLNNVVEGVLGGVLDDLLEGLLGEDGLLDGGLAIGRRAAIIESHMSALRSRVVVGDLHDNVVEGVLGDLVEGLLSDNGLLGFLTGTLDELFANPLGAVDGAVDDVLDILPLDKLLNKVCRSLRKIVNQVGELVDDVLEEVQALLSDLLTDLQTVVQAVLDLDVDAALNAVTNDLLNNAIKNVDELVDELIENLQPTLEEVVNLVDSVLITLTKGLDFNLVNRLGERFSIGALQAVENITDTVTWELQRGFKGVVAVEFVPCA